MYDYGWRMYMPDIARWNGMDQLSEKFHNASPYAYVMNNPVMFFDPDGRDMAPSTGNWLQDMWNATDSYSYWTNNGNGAFVGGNVKGGMSHENFTNFYNFLAGGGTGSYTYWTGGAMPSSTYSNIGGINHENIQGLVGHKVNIIGNNNNSSYSPWQVEAQKGINWIGDHFVAEGTAAVKHGSYFSILLKNGIGATFGTYTENRYTVSYNASPKISEAKKFDISASYGIGAGYNYNDENRSNQVSFGILTFGVEISKSNIFVGWNPNINLGIGIGGELGFKSGLNFQTDGWFDYNNW